MKQVVTVIGAGLAGSEACYQLAKRGYQVKLYEMRPKKMTSAHKTSGFAELICSNSLRGASLENAVGVLKEEMRLMYVALTRATYSMHLTYCAADDKRTLGQSHRHPYSDNVHPEKKF